MSTILRTTILISLIVATVITLWPRDSGSGTMCTLTDRLDEVLSDQVPIAVGKVRSNKAVLYVNEEDRTWTLVYIHPAGAACIVAQGTNFDLVPLPRGEKAALTVGDKVDPPARYDAPIPIGQVVAHYNRPVDIPEVCSMGRRPDLIACSYVSGNVCHMVLPHGVTPGSPVWRHEQAHCNGWPRSHPR